MTIPTHVKEMLQKVRARFDVGPLKERMLPDDSEFTTLRPLRKATAMSVAKYWSRLEEVAAPESRDAIADPQTMTAPEIYDANIENFIGTVKMPVGIIGPLRINGLNAHGDFHVPMATTEAALIASYARGAYAATRSGGISTALLYEGVMRTPAFVFADLLTAGMFVEWVVNEIDTLKEKAEATTRHGKLVSVEPAMDNNVVFLICRYTTGDAAGQNMVTIATNALCEEIAARCPITPKAWYIEGNFSGDKKASFLGLVTGRGRKVSASVTLSAEAVEKTLGTRVQEMLDYGQVANLGSHLSGQMGGAGSFCKRSGRAIHRHRSGRRLCRRKRHGHHPHGGAR